MFGHSLGVSSKCLDGCLQLYLHEDTKEVAKVRMNVIKTAVCCGISPWKLNQPWTELRSEFVCLQIGITGTLASMLLWLAESRQVHYCHLPCMDSESLYANPVTLFLLSRAWLCCAFQWLIGLYIGHKPRRIPCAHFLDFLLSRCQFLCLQALESHLKDMLLKEGDVVDSRNSCGKLDEAGSELWHRWG